MAGRWIDLKDVLQVRWFLLGVEVPAEPVSDEVLARTLRPWLGVVRIETIRVRGGVL